VTEPRQVTFELAGGGSVVAYDRPVTNRLHQEIFEDSVYEVGDLGPAPRIVDCGANVGLATAWFVTRHPGASVVALEPEPDALALLRRNVAENGWTGVTVVDAAAHS
jgi:methylase of polypeptide subunit release factors